MKQVASPDISVIDFLALMDISTASPSITLTNNSTEANPANLQWVFEIYSPSGVPVHQGDFTSPDRVNWTTDFVQNSGFPKPYNSIEWGNYKIIVKVKDSNGTIFEHDPVFIPLCRPTGNNSNSKNTYGAAKIFITTKCKDARLFAEDRTNYAYSSGNSDTGTPVSKKLTIIYPQSDEGVSTPNFEITQFSLASIPITQSGSGYQYFVTSVIDYNIDSQVTIRVKYIAKDTFSVYCNLDLSPVLCELQKLHNDIENGTCKDATKAKEIHGLVSGKLLMATIAMLFPQSNEIDPFKLIEEINKLTGWECDCCTSGVVPLSSVANLNDVVYEFVSDGGDISGSIEEIVGGIRIHVGDYSYSFQMCASNTSTAFTITPSVAGKIKNFCLNVNKNTLATEILDIIKDDTTLLNTLNSLVVVNSGSYGVSVDGKCVIPNEITCDYSFESAAMNVGEKLFIRDISLNNGQKKTVNFYFDQTNGAALSTQLNSLGIGIFGSILVSSKLVVTSDDNANAISGMSYDLLASDNSTLSSNQSMTVTKNCGSATNSNLNQILQGLIDYVCTLILGKIKSGRAYSIKFLQAIGGAVDNIDITSDHDAGYLFDRFIYSFNQLVDVVKSSKETNCTNVRGLFNAATTLSDSAILYGVDNNVCLSWSPKTLALKIAQLAAADADVQAAFCQAIQGCATPVCDPVTNAVATFTSGTPNTLSVEITNTGATKYRAYFYPTLNPSSISLIKEQVASGTATTIISWSVVLPLQYSVVVTAVCANGKESLPYTVATASCDKPASLNVIDNGNSFSVTWGTVPVGAEKVRVLISYPNGGNFTADYDPSPNTAVINKPAGVYGQFVFTVKTVCDVASDFVSEATNSVTVNVSAPASCPATTGLEVTALAYNQASFKAVKPLSGTAPNSYTLRIIPQIGAPITYTTNMPGSEVTWSNIPLTANTIYSWEVISNCTNGSGDPVNGGTFTTPPNTANNSTITNNAAGNATPASIMIDGSLVFIANPLNTGSAASFVSHDYITVEVRLKACDAGATAADLTSNSVVYPGVQDASDPELFIFSNVNITGGYQIEFH